MKFCKNCGNMYYLSVTEESPDKITFYCRNCGDTEDNETEMICMCKSSKIIETNENIINRYTKLDPTLPRVQTMPCPNTECPTNTEAVPRETILIRYDHTNMKYLYLCSICDFSWKTDISKA